MAVMIPLYATIPPFSVILRRRIKPEDAGRRESPQPARQPSRQQTCDVPKCVQRPKTKDKARYSLFTNIHTAKENSRARVTWSWSNFVYFTQPHSPASTVPGRVTRAHETLAHVTSLHTGTRPRAPPHFALAREAAKEGRDGDTASGHKVRTPRSTQRRRGRASARL